MVEYALFDNKEGGECILYTYLPVSSQLQAIDFYHVSCRQGQGASIHSASLIPCTVKKRFWRISLHVTDDAIAKFYVT